METSRKYGRTYHFNFSPGSTSDDRINHAYWNDIKIIESNNSSIVNLEKLDGENNCINQYGVFARSHGAPTTSPWTSHLRQKWNLIKNDLGDIEIFGENIYAIHSIEYKNIENHYYVFAVRVLDKWLSWEEVEFYASIFDLPTVPVLKYVNDFSDEKIFKNDILELSKLNSKYDSYDVLTNLPCTLEGIVSRNIGEYDVDKLSNNVFKYVRKGHVKTDEHWTRNWRRAKLNYEYK